MVRIIENSGETTEKAIIILDADDHYHGIDLEYEYLAKKHGRKGEDWKLEKQSLLSENNKMYDKMIIQLSDDTERTIFFDITDFFGKGMGF